jgi:soluble lytic murein transglycosylase
MQCADSWVCTKATSNEYTRAQANLLAGQSYLALELPEQAYARFQDSVSSYPLAYDSYTALVSAGKRQYPCE